MKEAKKVFRKYEYVSKLYNELKSKIGGEKRVYWSFGKRTRKGRFLEALKNYSKEELDILNHMLSTFPNIKGVIVTVLKDASLKSIHNLDEKTELKLCEKAINYIFRCETQDSSGYAKNFLNVFKGVSEKNCAKMEHDDWMRLMEKTENFFNSPQVDMKQILSNEKITKNVGDCLSTFLLGKKIPSYKYESNHEIESPLNNTTGLIAAVRADLSALSKANPQSEQQHQRSQKGKRASNMAARLGAVNQKKSDLIKRVGQFDEMVTLSAELVKRVIGELKHENDRDQFLLRILNNGHDAVIHSIDRKNNAETIVGKIEEMANKIADIYKHKVASPSLITALKANITYTTCKHLSDQAMNTKPAENTSSLTELVDTLRNSTLSKQEVEGMLKNPDHRSQQQLT